MNATGVALARFGFAKQLFQDAASKSTDIAVRNTRR